MGRGLHNADWRIFTALDIRDRNGASELPEPTDAMEESADVGHFAEENSPGRIFAEVGLLLAAALLFDLLIALFVPAP
ncbi:MAG: hypothetical protein WDM91_04225 [Rhizomicrobium sp.]